MSPSPKKREEERTSLLIEPLKKRVTRMQAASIRKADAEEKKGEGDSYFTKTVASKIV